MVRRRRGYFFGFPFPFINVTVSKPSRLDLLRESKSYCEDLRDEINEEMADIDKEIGKLTSKAELVD